MASDLEDRAALGQLEDYRPLAEQLESIARELVGQLDVVSIEALRHRAAAAGATEGTATP